MSSDPKKQASTIIEYAPPFFPVPAVKYGGSERVVGGLANAWGSRSSLPFNVEVWAPGDSKVQQSAHVSFHPTVDRSTGWENQ